MAVAWADPPHGSSSWPRCRHAFSKACSCPLRLRVTKMPPSAPWKALRLPCSATSDERPTQTQPSKTLAISQRNTSGSRYAAFGSIRLVPKGSSERASSAGSSGAGPGLLCS